MNVIGLDKLIGLLEELEATDITPSKYAGYPDDKEEPDDIGLLGDEEEEDADLDPVMGDGEEDIESDDGAEIDTEQLGIDHILLLRRIDLLAKEHLITQQGLPDTAAIAYMDTKGYRISAEETNENGDWLSASIETCKGLIVF